MTTKFYQITESGKADGRFFVKTGKQIYTVGVEYPEHLNENVRTFKCSCCKGDGLCEHARAVIEYLEGLDEADEVVRTMRMQTEKYLAKICRKGE
jgi:hypothetical protein